MNFIVKYLLLTALVLASVCFPNFGLAQNDARAGQFSTGKPYTISVNLREEYDDNINASSVNEESSFKTIISPEFIFKYPMDQTMFSFSYLFDATYYNDRQGDEWDMGHTFVGRVNHKFTERFEIDLRNRFKYSAEPELGNGVAVNRRLGNGYSNDLNLDATYAWTERFSTVTGYNNTIASYEDPIISLGNDYVKHGVTQDFRLSVLPTTTAVVAYAYDTFDYEKSPRDFDTHTLTVGADHYLLREWLISGRVGAQYLMNENPILDDNLGPYANIKSVWNFLPRSSFTAGYSFRTQVTDAAVFGNQQTHTFDLGVSHAWTARFSTSLSAQYALASFDQNQSLIPVNQSFYENTFSAQLRASYAWTDWLSTDAGYIRSMSDSNVFGREFERNQVYIGIRGTY
ncbi:MAG: outer membrane beta-barrel protein [Blastochloris sp.]|nr:outer membrane beta-barrel protein [Blastochloris sp.]